MAYRDLRDFIHKLEKNDELRRISLEVDPVLEITEITDRVVRPAVRRCFSSVLKARAFPC